MTLVVGATGRLGRAVTAELLAGGQRVRAGCRTPGKAAELERLGADVVQLDLRDPAGFTVALAGMDRVFTAAHALTARARDSIDRVDTDGHKRLIDAAAAAGVSRFVYTSAQGAAPDHPAAFLRAKAEVERHLAASGLDYTILRPSAFMELYAHDLIGAAVLGGKRVMLLGDGRLRRNLVSVGDVARAAMLALEGAFPRRTLELAGPANFTERRWRSSMAACRAGGRSSRPCPRTSSRCWRGSSAPSMRESPTSFGSGWRWSAAADFARMLPT